MGVQLGKICRFQSGGTPSKSNPDYFGGSIPWITTTALTGSRISEKEAVDWITEKAIMESAAKIVPANSIMVGTRVGVGKVAINTVEMSTSQDVISLLDIDETRWNKDFVSKFIQGKSVYLNSQARGATIKGIKIESLSNLIVPEIPLKEQILITNTLDCVLRIITAYQKQIHELNELVKARFVELFGRPALNEKMWELHTIGEVCSKITDGEHQNPEFVEDGVPMVMANNVKDNAVSFEGCRYISESDYQKFSKKCKPEKGDVLLVSRGATIGRCCENNREEDFSLMGSVILLKRREIITSSYLVNYLKNDDVRPLLYKTSSASAQQAIYIKDLSSRMIMLPPLNLQMHFSDFVSQVDKSKTVIQKALDETQTLFDSLMQQYFG